MKEPNPPFLEIGFYFASTPEAKAYDQLVRALTNTGAEFTGEGRAYRFHGAKDTQFASIHEHNLEPVVIRTTADFEAHIEDADTRLIQVEMKGATRTTDDTKEVVGYVSISPDAVGKDRHPLSIVTDGELICSPLRKKSPERARAIGEKVYERFLELLETLKPTYAAITCEYALECPADLRRDPRSLAFRDFFVSGTDLGRKTLDTVRKIFDGAYTKAIADGLYVSSFEYLNPAAKALDAETAQWKSVDVAKLIASLRIP